MQHRVAYILIQLQVDTASKRENTEIHDTSVFCIEAAEINNTRNKTLRAAPEVIPQVAQARKIGAKFFRK